MSATLVRKTVSSALFTLVVLIVGLVAVSASHAVCLATGKSCGLNSASNDRLCCPGMVCGYGNVCQPGCRINGQFYPNQTAKPGNPCQICQPSNSTTQWTNRPNGATCGSSVTSVCDRADTCSAGTCVPNYEPATKVCRPEVPGGCDVEEKCTGASATCPADDFRSSATVCRGPADVCDAPENCSGSSPNCPGDAKEPTTTVCRPPADDCDAAENCNGSANACPPDVVRPVDAACTPDSSDCTADKCDGVSTECQHPTIPCSFCSEPASVVVFFNDTYVDTSSASPNAEADNIRASLVSLGHTVTTFTTGIAATDWTTALAGKQVLVMPEQRLSPAPELGNVLSTAAKTVIKNFVLNGGGLIINATQQNLDQWFLNKIFGFAPGGDGQYTGNWRLESTAAAGTAFCGAQSSLFANADTQIIFTTAVSAVPGGKSIYVDPLPYAADHSIVSILPYGSGEVVILGWDWDSAAPNGSVNGGWLNILDRAVYQVTH